MFSRYDMITDFYLVAERNGSFFDGIKTEGINMHKAICILIFCFFSRISFSEDIGFETYKVDQVFYGKNHELCEKAYLNIDSDLLRLRKNSIGKKINFAGHYIVLIHNCGGGAVCGEILDVKNGCVAADFPDQYIIDDPENENYVFDVNYRIDSRLLIISGKSANIQKNQQGEIVMPKYKTSYYNFIDNKFNLISEVIN